MKKFVYLLLIQLLLTAGVFAVKEPDLPNEPSSPDGERDSRGETKTKNDKKIPIKLKLCDGREIQGEWDTTVSEFTFSHQKQRVHYTKSLKIADIALIKITSWRFVEQRSKQNGKNFKVVPEKVMITTKEGEKYYKKSLNGTPFMELSLENKLGKTRMYTYWMDFLVDKKWDSGLPYTEQETRSECHPDVVTEITIN